VVGQTDSLGFACGCQVTANGCVSEKGGVLPQARTRPGTVRGQARRYGSFGYSVETTQNFFPIRLPPPLRHSPRQQENLFASFLKNNNPSELQ
jgi:hypothetical protein